VIPLINALLYMKKDDGLLDDVRRMQALTRAMISHLEGELAVAASHPDAFKDYSRAGEKLFGGKVSLAVGLANVSELVFRLGEMEQQLAPRAASQPMQELSAADKALVDDFLRRERGE
jgi:hypothetical protein